MTLVVPWLSGRAGGVMRVERHGEYTFCAFKAPSQSVCIESHTPAYCLCSQLLYCAGLRLGLKRRSCRLSRDTDKQILVWRTGRWPVGRPHSVAQRGTAGAASTRHFAGAFCTRLPPVACSLQPTDVARHFTACQHTPVSICTLAVASRRRWRPTPCLHACLSPAGCAWSGCEQAQ